MKANMSIRLTIVLIACLFVAPLFGQISLGASLGGVLSTPKAQVTDQSLQMKIPAARRASFTAGLHADVPLGESGFRLMPALRFTDKGYLARTELMLQQTKVTFDLAQRMGFMELSLPVGFAAGVGDQHVFLGLGPYAAIAVGGRMKTNVSINGTTNTSDEPIKFGSGAGQYDRVDYGAEITAGMVFAGGLFLKAGYAYGIPNLSNDPASPLRQRCFTLSVGFFFLR
jgi:hypothetical protein